MGFGILFFGCFLTYFGALTPIGSFTYLLGSAIMLYALYKLFELNKMFLFSAIASFVFMIMSLAIVVMFVFGMDGNSVYSIFTKVQNYFAPALLILIHIAIYLTSKEVGLTKIQGWTIVNNLFISVYIICDVLSVFITGVEVTPRLGLICLIAQVLYSVFMLVILFTCYAKICYEEDEFMENASSGVPLFDFLNRLFNRATDKSKKNKSEDKEDE